MTGPAEAGDSWGGAPCGVPSQVVASARAQTDAGLAPLEWTEAEIKLAIGRHPEAENDLFHSNLVVIPAILSPA
jgi:hypothetical protein